MRELLLKAGAVLVGITAPVWFTLLLALVWLIILVLWSILVTMLIPIGIVVIIGLVCIYIFV